MNLSVAQDSSRRSSLANKRTERLAKENEIIKEETSGLWGFLEKVGLSATASELTGIKASTRTPQSGRHQKSEIRAASVSTPTTTTSEEPASPPQPQRSVYAGAPSAASSPGTDVTDVTPSATLSAESSLPSHASPPPPPPAPPPPKPPPPPPKPPPPHPTRHVAQKGLQRDPQGAPVRPSDDVTPSAEHPLPSDTSPPTSLPSNKPPPPAPTPPPRPATSQRPEANQSALMDSIKGGRALRSTSERVAREASRATNPTGEVAQGPEDEITRKLAAALTARRGAIGDSKDDEVADWDFGRARVRKRPKAGKTKARPYL